MVVNRYIGSIAVGAVLGYGLSWFVHRDVSPAASIAGAGLQASDIGSSKDQVTMLRVEYEQQIAALRAENEELRRGSNARSGGREVPVRSATLTAEERAALNRDVKRKFDDANKQRDLSRLLAAGYTKERMEWLKARAVEHEALQNKADTDRRSAGLPVDLMKSMGYLFDKDIGLRYEIGDEEYEKYLLALHRPTSVVASEIPPGTIADTAGLKPGDEIVYYDNKRVFNLGELDGLGLQNQKVAGTVSVKIKRDGQILQLQVPNGWLGVRSTPFPKP